MNRISDNVLAADVQTLFGQIGRREPAAVKRSWPFRLFGFVTGLISCAFGIASLVFILAILACIPIVQFLSLGYLLEACGRCARSGRMRSGLIGLQSASRIGGFIFGTWLILWPLRLLALVTYHAYLIDPTSSGTAFLSVAQIVVTILVIAHIAAAWLCGGRLRHFFWPLIAPVSLSLWIVRRFAGRPRIRATLNFLLGWISPNLVDDLVRAEPLSDWFLPAVFTKEFRQGTLLDRLRDSAWNFFVSLRLPYYFWLGLRGFAGSFLWLLPPTLLMLLSTSVFRADFSDPQAADAVGGLIGLIAMTWMAIVFVILPGMQARFAAEGSMSAFWRPLYSIKMFRKAPVLHWLAIALMCVLALPLFISEIERIPPELTWTLSLFFIALTWPAKIMIGWAYGRAAKRNRVRPWYVAYPVLLLTVPVTFAFALVTYLTQFTSWTGAWGLFENNVFLLPAPFWLG